MSTGKPDPRAAESQAPAPWTLSAQLTHDFYRGMAALGPLALRAEYVLVVKGYEHMQYLTCSFPLPLPGVGGSGMDEQFVKFYETRDFHAARFLADVNGKELDAEIRDLCGDIVFSLKGVRISGVSHDSIDWAVKKDDALLRVTARILWRKAHGHMPDRSSPDAPLHVPV